MVSAWGSLCPIFPELQNMEYREYCWMARTRCDNEQLTSCNEIGGGNEANVEI